ncbi:TetR/AcrR family transcriptional regulator [Comamonas odontotermitis]|uniref:TetR/AcrR family transcriptional regulator n=1 Tax=Comamonas odontotermitis TaxID=379895 RepID=UPI0036730456
MMASTVAKSTDKQRKVAPRSGKPTGRLVVEESPWAGAPSREVQREAKRNAVLTTAAKMFNERGFPATSLDDIAARLQVSKPTLYYYVKNKDEILLECVRKGLHMTLDGIEASRRAGGNALDQLQACMRSYAAIVIQPFGTCLIRVGDEQVPAESRKELRRLKSAIDHEFRKLVAQGIEQGLLRPCDPKMAAFVIAGALSWIGRWYQEDGDYTAEQVIDQCVEQLLCGVLMPVPASPTVIRKAGTKKAPTRKGPVPEV